MEKKINLNLSIEHPLWKSRLKPYKKTIQYILDIACSESFLKNRKNCCEVAVVLASDEFVQKLNKEFRGKDMPTNVLSFPSGNIEFGEELGDIILALETIEREAKEQGKNFRQHSTHLLIHGFLHLLGYDHIKPQDAKKMERIEIKILKQMGIKNPYL